MAGFNYPTRVLKRKMKSPNYTPFAIDCGTGSPINLDFGKTESFFYFIFQLVLILVSIFLLYFTVLEPVVQTVQAKHQVSKSIEKLTTIDSGTIEKIKDLGPIVSESVNGNVLTLVVKIDRENLQQSLELAFSLSSVKEVYTDGKSISISFLSSGK